MSDIFKKITSIEPVDEDALKALNIRPSDDTANKPILRPLPEDMPEDDPVPEFITRETADVVEDIQKPVQPPRETPSMNVVATAVPAALTMSSSHDYAPSTGWMKWAGIAAVLIWLGASFAYLYGTFDLGRKLTDMSPMQIAGLVLAILFPAILLGLLFYALRQLSKMSVQAHELSRAAHALSTPDDSVISKTTIMSKAIKSEIDSVDARIDQALTRMRNLETVIKDQTAELTQATAATTLSADEVASRLSTQRMALESVAGTFDSRMAMLSTTLDEQSSKLEASTQLAEHKIQEARVSIDGAAEKINAASDVVKGNTIDAASTLTKSHEEIESLAEMIRARSAELDEVYRKHAQDLTAMIAELRDEQQNMSISLEERLTNMRDMSLSAKVSAESLNEASEAGKVTVQALAEATRLTDTAVKQRFAEMENMVKFSGEKADSISDRAARRVQDSLAQTRKEIARIENDMVALQTRLNAPQPAESLPLEEPEQPKPKKRNRIRLKPLEEDFPPVEPPQFADEAPSLRLRSTAEEEAVFEPHTLSQPHEDATVSPDTFSLNVEPLDFKTDLAAQDPDAEIIDFAPEALIEPEATPMQEQETLRPAAPATSEDIIGFGKRKSKSKEKSGWRWRDMLGGLERPDNAPSVTLSQTTLREVSDQRMLASLANLGLTPGAVVDDGCIIEAANIRKTKGAIAMSQAVARRMGDPVRHLHRAMEENPALKTDARAYVAQFQARIGSIESDREAIRTRLESEAGRAFLLCDAALNG